MNKKLLELLEKINSKKAEVKDLVEQDRIDDAEKAKAELVEMQRKFDIMKDIEDKSLPVFDEKTGKFVNGLTGRGMITVSEPQDAVHEFAQAARRGFVTDIMKEGSDPDGGYTVPEDIQTRINHYKEANAELRSLVSVEKVNTDKGARTYQTKAAAPGFAEVSEDGKVQEVAGPKYERITYQVKDYAGYMPVTNDLLADSDANITGEIVDWIGRNSVVTDNKQILSIIQAKTATDLSNLAGIKKAINVTLGQAYRANAAIITNDDGLNYLDTLEDLNKRPLLNPDPTADNEVRLRIGAKTIAVKVLPNSILETEENKVPFILGDLKEGIRIFDRQSTSILASNVAAVEGYNAFEQRGMLYRADIRADYKQIDGDAFVNGYITVGE